jgi:hypothetical protein
MFAGEESCAAGVVVKGTVKGVALSMAPTHDNGIALESEL